MMLPYLDQKSLYDAINFQLDSAETGLASANETAAQVRISTFSCPSDTQAGDRDLAGRTNYAVNRGVEYRRFDYNGAFGRRPYKFADFKDGTSSTVAMSEWVAGPGPYGHRDNLGTIFELPTDLDGPDRFDQFVNRCQGIDTNISPVAANDKGVRWLAGGYWSTAYNHSIGINGPSCISGGFAQEGAYSASSFHLGGGNVVFVDGHAKFVREAISLATWRAVGTRSGGEALNSGSF